MAGKQNHVSIRTTNENKIKEVSQKELQRLMQGIHSKLRKIAVRGQYNLI